MFKIQEEADIIIAKVGEPTEKFGSVEKKR